MVQDNKALALSVSSRPSTRRKSMSFSWASGLHAVCALGLKLPATKASLAGAQKLDEASMHVKTRPDFKQAQVEHVSNVDSNGMTSRDKLQYYK
jgi:hypothetical protein